MRKFVVALALAASATVANAGYLGNEATFQYYAYGGTYNDQGSPTTFMVDGGPNLDFGPYFTLTVTDTQIIYQYLGDVEWSSSEISLDVDGLFIRNGSLITSGAAVPDILGVSIDASSTGLGSFDIDDVTWNSRNVAVEWAELPFDAGSRVVLNVDFGDSPAVPEPATWALMIAGFGLVGAAARRHGATVSA